MRKFSYWLCFTLVAVPSVFGHVAWLLALAGVVVPAPGLTFLLMSFGSLVPPLFASLLPWWVVAALGLVMLFLVLRRLWLLVGKREGVPAAFSGVPKVLAYVGTWSFLLSLAVLLLTLLLRAGSGVPAGLLALPAMFCIPWAIFLAEAFSLRRAAVQ